MAKHTLVVEFDGDGPAYAAGDTVLGGRLVAVDFCGDRLAVVDELLDALIAITDQLERIGDTRPHKDGQYIEAARAAIAKANQ